VLAAGDISNVQAQAALEQLCRSYLAPVLAYARTHGVDLHEAQDVAQEFFARLGFGPVEFSETDIRSLSSLWAKISPNGSDPLARYLWDKHFCKIANGAKRGKKKCSTFVKELNRIVNGNSIFDPELFKKVTLSERTRALLQHDPQGENLKRLNRFLLEDAFPDEIVRRNDFTDLDPERGKFRSFLLTSLKRFLIDYWRRRKAQKRGGGKFVLSLEQAASEQSADLRPDEAFDRAFALNVLERTTAQLRNEYTSNERAKLFEMLYPTLTDDKPGYAEIAEALGMNEGTVKVAAHRFHRRYGALLRDEVAEIVATPEAIDEEIRYLFEALNLQRRR